jgi:hypothetical protein
MNWLEELEKRKAQLEKELAQVKEQIYQAKLEQHGLSIGCIVISKGREFKVIRAEFLFEKPWVWGVSKNKNGEFGTREHCLYGDWELK